MFNEQLSALLVKTNERDLAYLDMNIQRGIKDAYPQFNEKTKIQSAHGNDHHLTVALGDSYVRPPTGHRVNKKGLKSAFIRFLYGIHKWFVDNKYHAGDKPVGWREFDVSKIETLWIQDSENTPVYVPFNRTLEFKHFGYEAQITIDRKPYRADLHLILAYDGLYDILYIKTFKLYLSNGYFNAKLDSKTIDLMAT